MPAFGPSGAQTTAQDFFPTAGNWNWEQYKAWLDRANSQTGSGQANQDWAASYFQNRATNGMGDPDYAKGFGEWIAPGTDAAITNRQNRLNGVDADFASTFGGARQRVDDTAPLVGLFADSNQSNIDNTFNGAGGLAGSVHKGVVDNNDAIYGGVLSGTGKAYSDMSDRATGRFGDLAGTAGNVYSDLQAESKNIHGGLQGSNAAAFDQAGKTLDMIRPGGDAAAAQTARSFAPQVAATMGRLRAAGIDPNSPEASAILSRVETGRSRAMDDAYANNIAGYVDRANNLTLGKEDVNRGLVLDQLNNNQGLATQREAIGRDLGLGELQNDQSLKREATGLKNQFTIDAGKNYQNELVRDLGLNTDLGIARLNSSNANNDTKYGRTMDWYDKSNALDLSGFNTRAGLADQQNNEQLVGLGLKQDQFNTGANWLTNQTNQQNQAAGTLSNIGNTQYGQGMSSAGLAGNFGQQAGQNYQTTYGIEAPNSGWLTKALAGAAGTAVNAFAPGMGGMVTNTINGATGNGGYGGGAQQNPYIFSYGGWGG